MAMLVIIYFFPVICLPPELLMHVGQHPGAHYPHDVSPTFRQTHNQYHLVMFLLLVVPEIGWLIPSKISMCMLKSPLSHQIEYHSYVFVKSQFPYNLNW